MLPPSPSPATNTYLARQIAEELAFLLRTQTLKVRDTERPQVQRVQGDVAAHVGDIPALSHLLKEVIEALYDTKTELPDVQRVEVTNPVTIPDFPEIPNPPESVKVSEVPAELLEKIDALTREVKELRKAKPAPPKVEVQAPDLSPLSDQYRGVELKLQEAVDALMDLTGRPETVLDLSSALEGLKEIKESIDAMIFPAPQRLKTDSVGNLTISLIAEDVDSPGEFRAVQGQYDANGHFVLLTNGTGTGGGGGTTTAFDFYDGTTFEFYDGTAFDFVT